MWHAYLGTRLIFCNSYELQHELSDDKRFKKVVVDALEKIRRVSGDGLFTSVLFVGKY
jgi:cytochrome P450/NADPH-cytochrome P450 reductase